MAWPLHQAACMRQGKAALMVYTGTEPYSNGTLTDVNFVIQADLRRYTKTHLARRNPNQGLL